jgi:serine/threonine protein kinase
MASDAFFANLNHSKAFGAGGGPGLMPVEAKILLLGKKSGQKREVKVVISEVGENYEEYLERILIDPDLSVGIDGRVVKGSAKNLPQLLKFMEDVLTGIHTEALAGRVQGDIKPGNILGYNNGWAINDFDTEEKTTDPRKFLGDPWYTSHEEGGRFNTPERELWSLGVTMTEIIFGENLFVSHFWDLFSRYGENSLELFDKLQARFSNAATMLEFHQSVWEKFLELRSALRLSSAEVETFHKIEAFTLAALLPAGELRKAALMDIFGIDPETQGYDYIKILASPKTKVVKTVEKTLKGYCGVLISGAI